MTAISFVLMAATGTLIRALVSSPRSSFDRHLWATSGLNIAGSFLLGWVHGSDADVVVVVGVGGLGSLTTFSTFVWQLDHLARTRRSKRHAAGFAVVSVIGGVAAAALGHGL